CAAGCGKSADWRWRMPRLRLRRAASRNLACRARTCACGGSRCDIIWERHRRSYEGFMRRSDRLRFADGLANGGKQLVIIDWFLEITGHSSFQGAILELGWVGAGDMTARDVLGFINHPQPINDQKTIPGYSTAVRHIWRKSNIKQNQIGPLATNGADRRRAIGGGQYMVAA